MQIQYCVPAISTWDRLQKKSAQVPKAQKPALCTTDNFCELENDEKLFRKSTFNVLPILKHAYFSTFVR